MKVTHEWGPRPDDLPKNPTSIDNFSMIELFCIHCGPHSIVSNSDLEQQLKREVCGVVVEKEVRRIIAEVMGDKGGSDEIEEH